MKKQPAKKPAQLNVSIHREVLDTTGDFLSAVIVEYIYFRFNHNDRKPIWLRLDHILEHLPYIKRSGLDKKIKKLVKDGHIIMKKGVGKHYHKVYYSLSEDMYEACSGGSLMHSSKVYYNLDMAKTNLAASVIYAAIVNLLRAEDYGTKKVRGIKGKVGSQYGKVEDSLLLDTQKLVAGSGLSLNKVRDAIKWLIKNKKIEAEKVFGNKRVVSLPPDTLVNSGDLESYFNEELPTESFPHADPEEDLTEY